jgi:two-component system response regulator RegA
VLWPVRVVARAPTNLLHNALHASIDGALVHVRATLGDGLVRVSVIDRGAGMSAEAVGRAGEPFFSTKPAGLGTGLGHRCLMLDRASLVIVEDDNALRERLRRAFEARGFEVRATASAGDAELMARQDPPELVLLDLRIGADNGLALIPTFKAIDPETRIVVLTGYGSVATAVQAVRQGALHYLTKPADVDEILAAFQEGVTTSVGPAASLQPVSLDRVEWEHIHRVLAECQGNISEAARALGLHRRTLQRKLAKYPVRR